jgi:predicted AlkP superfamily phosphohydrolase/phosphomutase
MTQKRVLIIGLDGATFDLIEPWASAGLLPNLAHLMRGGSRGRLMSTLHPLSAPAWATFMTGVNQGKHGLYDFVQRQHNSYDLKVTNASHIRAPSIFEIASQQEKRVIAVNVPYTSPPPSVNGVIIGGPFAPVLTRDMVHPSTYFNALEQIVPGYFILPDYDSSAADPLSTYADRLLQGIALREQLSLHLLQTERWDLFQVVFMAPDEAQHTYWEFQDSDSPYRHVIRRVYQRADQAIGALLTQLARNSQQDETIVIVISDHGGGPFRWMVNLNCWLAESGYLQFRVTAGTNLWKRLKGAVAKEMARAYRHVPARTRLALRRRLGVRHFDRMKGNFESILLASTIEWKHTMAYSLGSGGNIFVNLHGREPAGIVRAGTEYEYLCRELSDQLICLTDPETGRPVVRRVYRREELYQGPFLDQAPDLIVEWQDYTYWGRGSYDTQLSTFEAQRQFDFSDQPLSGAHRMEGILIAYGPGVQAGIQIEKANLLDMAPTILGILGIPIPRYMDGNVLYSLFEDGIGDTFAFVDSVADLQIDGQFTYTPEEEAAIQQHLKNLGYL